MTHPAARCPHCGCDRLACPWGEDVAPGFPLICGQCGSLSTADYVTDRAGELVGVCVRRPTIDESRAFYADEQVQAWQREYAAASLERSGAGRGPRGETVMPIRLWEGE